MKTTIRRLLSFTLCFSAVFAAFVPIIGLLAVRAEEIPLPDPGDKPIVRPEFEMPPYLDAEEIWARKPVKRHYDQESLGSYVIEFADGTSGLYVVAEKTKYYGEHGVMLEKDLTIQYDPNSEKFGITASDILPYFPLKLADGVWMTSPVGSIGMSPLRYDPEGKGVSDDKRTVRYDGAFGEGTSLVYTPTFSGIKEDIILDRPPEKNTFGFVVESHMLQPELTEEGWIFRDPTHKPVEGEEPEYIHLGQCIIWDANDDTVIGDIKVSPAQDENKWIVTLVVPEDYLYSGERKYPVTVDPTFYVYCSNTSPNILDAQVSKSAASTNYGLQRRGNIGSQYKDQADRVLVRTPGLASDPVFQALNGVCDAWYHVWDGSGLAKSGYTYMYAFRGASNWSETGVTWNTSGMALAPDFEDRKKLGNYEKVSFSLRNLADRWIYARDNIPAPSEFISKGFILKLADESATAERRSIITRNEINQPNRMPYVEIYFKNDQLTNFNISITGSSSIYSNDAIDLQAIYLSGVTTNPTWTTNNSMVVKINSTNGRTCRVQGVSEGRAVIRAQIGGKYKELTITVKKSQILVVPGYMGTELEAKSAIYIPGWVGTLGLQVKLLSDEKIWPLDSDNDYNRMRARLVALECTGSGEPVYSSVGVVQGGYGYDNTYQALITQLNTREWEAELFGYDWRLSFRTAAMNLNSFITQQNYGKVALIGHSAGGIVLSHFAKYGSMITSKIFSYITLGTPHLGIPDAAKALFNGRSEAMAGQLGGMSVWLQMMTEVAVHSMIRDTVANFQSAYELLPNKKYFLSRYYLETLSISNWHIAYISFAGTITKLQSESPSWNTRLMQFAEDEMDRLVTGDTHILQTTTKAHIVAGVVGPNHGKPSTSSWDTTVSRIVRDYHYADTSSSSLRAQTWEKGDGYVGCYSATIGGQYHARTYYVLGADHQVGLVNDEYWPDGVKVECNTIKLIKNILNTGGDYVTLPSNVQRTMP